MVEKDEIDHQIAALKPIIKAQLEPSIAKIQLENIQKLYEALGYLVEIHTNIDEGNIIHKISIYRGGPADPSSRHLIYIEELG